MTPIPWHTTARTTLEALRARGAHALLLHGPAGTGKWELAMSFARDLLCETTSGRGRACGACPSCVLMAAGNHPDLRVIVPDVWASRRPTAGFEEQSDSEMAGETAAAKSKPSREIKIDQVRELASLTSLSAHRGGARVIVLAPAESLNLPAANALLKGLEEPPPATVFLLTSEHIDRCLPTIVSRCALVRVAIPPRALALQWLGAQGLAAEQASQRLTEAGGAPLGALRVDEDTLSAEMRATLLQLLRRGAELEAAEVAGEVPRTVPIGAAVALFQRWGWDYFAFRMGCPLRYHPADMASFEALSRHWSLRAASDWIDRLHGLRALADHPLNARAAIEGLLLAYIGSMTSRREKPLES